MSEALSDKPEIEIVEEDLVRFEIKRIATQRGLKMTQIAHQAGLAYGTFSSWLGGHYNGNTTRICEAAQTWITAQTVAALTRNDIPTTPNFVETETARGVFKLLAHAQYAPGFVVIAGAAGVGKTTAARRHRATNPNVTILTGEPCFGTPRMVLDCLAQELELTERYSSQTVSRAIQRRLRGSKGLVIIDEAQHLSSQSIDQLRTLYDLTDVGFAIVGNETVYSRMEGHSREAAFAQLYSRVDMRMARKSSTRDDIAALLNAWKIEDPEQRRILTAIARKPGALRSMTKVLRLAHVIAGGETLTVKHVTEADQEISNTRFTKAE